MMIKLLSPIPCNRRSLHYFPKGFQPIPWLGSLQLPIFIEETQFSCHLHYRPKKCNWWPSYFILPPLPRRFSAVSPKASAWFPGSTFSNSPYSFKKILCYLHHPQKPEKEKITIGDKITFHYPPDHNASIAAPNDSSALSPGYIISNSPYSLRNCNQYLKISSNTKKQKNIKKLTIKFLFTIPPTTTSFPLFSLILSHNILDRKSWTPHIHWVIAICMPPPPPPKKQKKSKIIIDDKLTFHYTPAPDVSYVVTNDASAQSPGLAVFNYPYQLRKRNQYFKTAPDTKKTEKQIDLCPRHWWPWCCWQWWFWCLQYYWQWFCLKRLPKYPYSLRKCNQYFKNSPNIKKISKNIADAPNVDAKIAADGDTADASNTTGDYYGSTDSKISPYLLINRNRDPNYSDDDSASSDYEASPDSRRFQT